MTPRSVPTASRGIRVSATCPLVHRCPHVDELDVGEVTLSWVTTTVTIELHSLAAHLSTYAEAVVSHEDLAQRLVEVLAACGVAEPSVASSWSTAGFAVDVRT